MMNRREAIARMSSVALFAIIPGHSERSEESPAGPSLRSGRHGFQHPDPRPGITAANVIAEDKLPDRKAIRRAFQAARDYPEVFDGLYCPCECSDTMHHRSLLSCFESTQPVGCHGCRDAADFVAPLAKEGKSLAEIRAAVDKKFD